MLLKSLHQNVAPHDRTQSYLGAVTAANGLHFFGMTSSDYDMVTKLTYPSTSIIKGLMGNKTLSNTFSTTNPTKTGLRDAAQVAAVTAT
jgi:hypothetical protein